MAGMFCNCKFNQDINNWDVSSVKDMRCMFMQNQYFNKPLNNWDVSNVKLFASMFYASIFN